MPKLVYINVNTIKTLSERQYHSGLGEVIKHGLIRDRAYFEWIKANKEAIAERKDEALAHMVEGSCLIKEQWLRKTQRNMVSALCLISGIR